MSDIDDTICAVSSPSLVGGGVGKSIIRIAGDEAYRVLGEMFRCSGEIGERGVFRGGLIVDDELEVEASVYAFFSPHSYTGQDLAEIHFFAAEAVVDAVLKKVSEFSRLAEAGEFTRRAYLNGKLDLSQAEAVAEIVSSSNRFQLDAAQKLLAGKLCQTIAEIRSEILDLLSLIEAGLDFSEEDIEFISAEQVGEKIAAINCRLDRILNESIRYEGMIDLPSVGLAGASNAGKSSLLNVLLGSERSIVSSQRATTRDVLDGVIEIDNCTCTLFDCAGLVGAGKQTDPLDELGRSAAVEALKSAHLLLFCVDVSKDDFSQDIEIFRLVNPENFILVATKSDVLDAGLLAERVAGLEAAFGAEAVVTSTESLDGIDLLREVLGRRVGRIVSPGSDTGQRIAINLRHRQVVSEAIKNLGDAAGEMKISNDEIAAMLLRQGYEYLAGIEKEDIDEAVLDRIFASFCIGK